MKKGVPDGLSRISFPLSPGNGSGRDAWDDIIAGQAPLDELAACPEDQTATIVYTSGSTGTPKGAMISFGAMHRSAKGVSDHLNFSNQDRALSYLPPCPLSCRHRHEIKPLYAFTVCFMQRYGLINCYRRTIFNLSN